METDPKRPLTDEERLQLAAQLDKELDDYIAGLEKKPYSDGWPQDRWEEEMEKHPFFMKNAPEPGSELHPLYEGLQKLKYDPDENTPEELATSYKEDGNFNFKHKNYRLAILSYTEGIRAKCGNPEIEASLLNNRSAAHYFLKNYRSSLRDSELALKIKPDYEKAMIRAANCCYEVKQYEKALSYCDKILEGNKDTQILELRQKCVKAAKIQDRDRRLKEKTETKKTKEQQNLLNAIRSRGITVGSDRDGGVTLDDFEPVLPQFRDFKVHLNEDNRLVWPVVFMIPEFKLMDFIQEFNEDETFADHINIMFSERREFDEDNKYTQENLRVYFKDLDTNKGYAVDKEKTLGEVLGDKRFKVISGAPAFLIVIKGSQHEKELL